MNVSQENKRIARNATFLYLRMIVALIVNLYTSRVLLNALGVEDYGVYNIVAGFVSLFGFLNSTLSSSAQRFYNYEGTIKGANGVQNIYVTSLLTHSVIALVILVILETVGLWYVNNIMVVPNNRLLATNILFQMSTFSMILMMMQIPYSGIVMAKERMDFFALVSLADVFLKLLVALIVSWSDYDNLVVYGALLALVSVFDISMYICYCKKNFPEIRLKRNIDKYVLKSMLSFSGWNIIGTFAFMMKGQGENMLLNYFFGPIINAARGIAYQVNGAISSFSSNIFTAFGPQIVSSYADGEYGRIKKIMFAESKICFSLIALLMVPTSFEMDFFLRLWLGELVPEHTSLFAILVLIDSLICTLNTPCTQIIQATGNIKYYQIGSSIVNICLLLFSWVLLLFGFSAKSIFIAIIFFSCINQLVCIIFVNKNFEFGLTTYFKDVIIHCCTLTIILPIVPFFIHILLPPTFIRVIVIVSSSTIYGLVVIYLTMLNKSERDIVKNIVKSKIIRKLSQK